MRDSGVSRKSVTGTSLTGAGGYAAMQNEFHFVPSHEDQFIKLLRKLRWIGLEREARDLLEAGPVPQHEKLAGPGAAVFEDDDALMAWIVSCLERANETPSPQG